MKTELMIMHLSKSAWADFCKEWKSWVLLAAGGVVLQVLIMVGMHTFPEYFDFMILFGCLPIALYTAILQQNGLDAVYRRKLNMLKITPSILFASLFFIALSLYNPFPEYIDYLVMVFPEDFQFLFVLNWIVHIIISYLLMRCMFVGMLLLEEKCTVFEAFKKSFKLTAHHILLLFVLFFYLAAVLFVSSLTFVGYFIMFPYAILMKALVFKHLRTITK